MYTIIAKIFHEYDGTKVLWGYRCVSDDAMLDDWSVQEALKRATNKEVYNAVSSGIVMQFKGITEKSLISIVSGRVEDGKLAIINVMKGLSEPHYAVYSSEGVRDVVYHDLVSLIRRGYVVVNAKITSHGVSAKVGKLPCM